MQREKPSVPLPHGRPVAPWNKGRSIGPKPPLRPKQAWAIRLHLRREERLRDLAMFDLAIDSKLRADGADPRQPARLARPPRRLAR